MKYAAAFVWSCCLTALVGCGGSSHPGPPPAQCAGVEISGTLADSLTSAPISSATVAFETGTSPGFQIFLFSVAKTAKSDANGKFKLCASSAPNPSAVIITALDTAGNAYPALVAPVSASIDFGHLLMGGCRGICFNGQQQTSAPAVITGVITSDPVAKSGSVFAQFAMLAPDNANNLWVMDQPILKQGESNSFQTTAGSCAGSAPFCASYTFTLPSQNPVVHGAIDFQQIGDPTYVMSATLAGGSCTPPTGLVVFQQDGVSFLTGSPGAQLTAANMVFQSCQ